MVIPSGYIFSKVCLVFFLILFQLINIEIFSQWELRTNGLPDWDVADVLSATNDSSVIMWANSEPIYLSNDLGYNWDKLHISDYNKSGDACIIDRDLIWYCTYDGKIYHSFDGGINWELQYESNASSPYFNFIKFFDENNGVVVGDANDFSSPAEILITTNGGSEWVSINQDYLISVFSRDVFYPIEFPSMTVGYFADTFSDKLFKTEDGGATWFSISKPDGVGAINMIKFFDENIGLLVSLIYNKDNYVYRTLDGGKSWKKLSLITNQNLHDIEFLPSSPANIWLSNYENLYYSSDTGNTWQQVQITEDPLEVHNIEFVDDSIGYILCQNSKIYVTENNGGIVTSVESIQLDILDDYKLYQNYPNPFNPSTVIKYSLPVGVKSETLPAGRQESIVNNVTIKVYDILGREIVVLVNEKQKPGNYEVEWNAENQASGVYIYKLKAGNYIESKKMILLK